jgi:curved DNA-binding protein CbpA
LEHVALARAVLSDEKRRALYDAGMYDPLDDDQEDVEVSPRSAQSPPMALPSGPCTCTCTAG